MPGLLADTTERYRYPPGLGLGSTGRCTASKGMKPLYLASNHFLMNSVSYYSYPPTTTYSSGINHRRREQSAEVLYDSGNLLPPPRSPQGSFDQPGHDSFGIRESFHPDRASLASYSRSEPQTSRFDPFFDEEPSSFDQKISSRPWNVETKAREDHFPFAFNIHGPVQASSPSNVRAPLAMLKISLPNAPMKFPNTVNPKPARGKASLKSTRGTDSTKYALPIDSTARAKLVASVLLNRLYLRPVARKEVVKREYVKSSLSNELLIGA
ncbi:hypothetical protein C8J56DRAFT_409702 [Mycena floridula]|nr:hypothetical protein C8J56DRAFT_409702 [Mycena floridula]